jgi:hypothetical protein
MGISARNSILLVKNVYASVFSSYLAGPKSVVCTGWFEERISMSLPGVLHASIFLNKQGANTHVRNIMPLSPLGARNAHVLISLLISHASLAMGHGKTIKCSMRGRKTGKWWARKWVRTTCLCPLTSTSRRRSLTNRSIP